jgi:hypothetical protein
MVTLFFIPRILRDALNVAEQYEQAAARCAVRCSVATIYPLECIYCGTGLGMTDSCDCHGAQEHRIDQAVKAFGVPRELLEIGR